jgi:hypothetical protein
VRSRRQGQVSAPKLPSEPCGSGRRAATPAHRPAVRAGTCSPSGKRASWRPVIPADPAVERRGSPLPRTSSGTAAKRTQGLLIRDCRRIAERPRSAPAGSPWTALLLRPARPVQPAKPGAAHRHRPTRSHLSPTPRTPSLGPHQRDRPTTARQRGSRLLQPQVRTRLCSAWTRPASDALRRRAGPRSPHAAWIRRSPLDPARRPSAPVPASTRHRPAGGMSDRRSLPEWMARDL